MKAIDSALLRLIGLQSVNYGVLILLCIIALAICIFLRRRCREKTYRILAVVCVSGLIGSVGLAAWELAPMVTDYISSSYIELANVKIISKTDAGFDLSGLREVSVIDPSGAEIVLKTSMQFEKGEFDGTVVYAKASGYLLRAETQTP